MKFDLQPKDFSITLPSHITDYIESLNRDVLRDFIADVAGYLAYSDGPLAEEMLSEFDKQYAHDIVDLLTGNDWIYFLQYLLAGYAQLSN